jgi:hypothetical protein
VPSVPEPTTRDEIPAVSAELLLLRVLVEGYLATAPRKRGEAFLRHVAQTLATEEELSAIVPIRDMNRQAMSQARRGALAAFRACLPTWLARLPRE